MRVTSGPVHVVARWQNMGSSWTVDVELTAVSVDFVAVHAEWNFRFSDEIGMTGSLTSSPFAH